MLTVYYQNTSVQLPRGVHFIGRHRKCLIQVENPQVSNFHVQLLVGEGEVVLQDMSLNGTLVNGCYAKVHELHEKDVVEVAGVQFTFQQYLLSEVVVGAGGFAAVHEAVFWGRHCVCKVIGTSKLTPKNQQHLAQELAILQRIDHPNCLKLLGIVQQESCVLMFMEFHGKELFDKVQYQGFISEKIAAFIMYQLLQAVKYLHEQEIVHRDIKLENCLVDEDLKVTLIDFGLSKEHEQKMVTLCGTLTTMPPEVLQQKEYGKECDVWSLGVVMYTMLCGHQPFYGEDEQLKYCIVNGIYDFDSNIWYSVSTEAKLLIQQMMTQEPEFRITIDEALKSPWIKEHVCWMEPLYQQIVDSQQMDYQDYLVSDGPEQYQSSSELSEIDDELEITIEKGLFKCGSW